jgi:hypothetical protein
MEHRRSDSMSSLLGTLLRCVGGAVAARGLKALATLVPFGDAGYEIAEEAYRRIRAALRERREERAALAAAAAAGAAETKAEAEQAAREVAAEQGLSPQVEADLVRYLCLVPCSVRQTMKRPADPTGKTVPASFALQGPGQLAALLPSRLPSFRPGDRPAGVGNWELVELLGAGGFGEVWLARNPDHHALKAALKFCLDEKSASSLRHEANLLARVMSQGRHPGIVALRQAYLDASPPCLEYEYVEGGDLAALAAEWQRGGKVPQRQVCALVERLAEIVGHAHRLSPAIVHRDLKPANVLVERADGKINLRVTDFGIGGVAARQVIEQTHKTTTRHETLATSLRGAHTPLYASPQQIKGDPPHPRDDVHALGVIWYQMLTGDLSAGVPADWVMVLEEAGLEQALITLLGSCVSSKPERRPADAADLAAHLAALLRQPSGPARAIPDALPVEEVPTAVLVPAPEPLVRLPDRPRPSQGPAWRPGRWLVASGSAVLAAVMALGAWQLWPRAAPVTPVTPAEKRAEEKPPPAPKDPPGPVRASLVGGKYAVKLKPDSKEGDKDGYVSWEFSFRLQAKKRYLAEVTGASARLRVAGPVGALAPPANKSRIFSLNTLEPGDYVFTVVADSLDSTPIWFRLEESDRPAADPHQPASPDGLPRFVKIASPDSDLVNVFGASSPDGKFFLSCRADSSVAYWTDPSKGPAGRFYLGDDLFNCLGVDGQGRLYAQVGKNPNPNNVSKIKPPKWPEAPNDLLVWDSVPVADLGKGLRAPDRVLEVNGLVTCLIRSPDGRWLYFIDQTNKKLGRIDSKTGAIEKRVDLSAALTHGCITADGKRLVCYGGERINVIDLETFTSAVRIRTGGKVYGLAATNSGLVFLAMQYDAERPKFPTSAVLDLSGKPEKPPLIPVPVGHPCEAVSVLPDQSAVLFAGSRRLFVCSIPAKVSERQFTVREVAALEKGEGFGHLALCPGGRVVWWNFGHLLSISR